MAGIWAVTGHGQDNASLAYGNPTAFFDVTSGSNGSCGGSYLCTAVAGYDGPTGNGTPNATVLAGGSTGGGGTTPPPPPPPPPPTSCAHSICSSGGALTSSCDPCVTKVCAQDSYCCATAWDGQCVGEVASICGSSQCSGGGTTPPPPPPPPTGTCSHAICSTGQALTSGCNSCASTICAQDSYCCTTAWDSVCVSEVGSICGQSC